MTQITSTATRLTPQWLYVREPFAVSIPTSQAGTGLTVTGRFAESNLGKPSAINAALENTGITAASDKYTFSVTSANLVAQLGASYVGRLVYLHLFDNAGTFHECYAFKVTDIDPDLLSAPK
jgi:hypothetical protein